MKERRWERRREEWGNFIREDRRDRREGRKDEKEERREKKRWKGRKEGEG